MKYPSHRLSVALTLFLILTVFSASCSSRQTSSPSSGPSGQQEETTLQAREDKREASDFESIQFTPDPVEPDATLVISTTGNAEDVRIHIPGASTARGPLPGSEFWSRNQDQLDLARVSTGMWEARCTAPSEAGVYPVSLIVTRNGSEQTITKPEWVLRVYPADFLNRPSFPTPERAIEAAIADSYPGAKIDTIERRPLLEEDRRNEAYNRLYLVTFTLPHGTPVRRPGRNSEFFYVLKDGPSGDWRVLISGSGP